MICAFCGGGIQLDDDMDNSGRWVMVLRCTACARVPGPARAWEAPSAQSREGKRKWRPDMEP